ncbi:MAG TPA: hypothetical protein VLU06_10370 [Thermoanaerobaculia bacterium]|nr:hypothetical protein [Thermoanaerobaculia bacterium]
MSFSVQERGRAIATFRFVEVRLMEIAAGWTPTIPEMEVKVLFGRHIWDFAQHADALGKRTFELRLPEQHSLPPSEPFAQLLEDAARVGSTSERLAVLYDVLLPGLEQRYREYLAGTDTLVDAPSCVILERIIGDYARQRRDADRLRSEIGLPAAATHDLRRRDAAISTIVAAAV